MNLFKIFIIFSIILSLPARVLAIETNNTGFISESVWFSEEELVLGESVNIYTALFNNSSSVLEGSVTFFDKDVVLGVKTFSIPEKSVRDVKQSWIVTSGDHEMYASLSVKQTSIELGEKITKPIEFTIQAPIVPEKDPVTGEAAEILSDVDNIQEKIIDSIPPEVSDKLESSLSGVESFRVETSSNIEEKKDAKQEVVDNLKSLPEKDSVDLEIGLEDGKTNVDVKSTPLDTPLAYAGLFFYTILSYIFKSTIIFYGLCIILIFLVLRAIYRAMRRRS